VYIDQQIGVDATLGWNITHAWQLSYTFVARKVKVIGTTLPGIPPITSRFEGTNGIGTTHELLHRVSLVYDTRDDITIPTRGMQAVVYGGVASRNVDWDASLFTEVGGDGRFYDRNSFSANLELRQTVLSLDAFSTHIDIQVAPFIDTGRVFRSASTWPIRHLHNVFGVGFRGIAPPSVVGYVDIGKGHEGIAVFTGIGYPF